MQSTNNGESSRQPRSSVSTLHNQARDARASERAVLSASGNANDLDSREKQVRTEVPGAVRDELDKARVNSEKGGNAVKPKRGKKKRPWGLKVGSLPAETREAELMTWR